MAGNVIDELVNTLYETIDDAPSVPLSNKCVIEREKALDILEEIRANLPSELKMANEIVEKRNDFISAGKKEYDTKIKQAEEMAKQKVNDHELLIEARKRANEIIASAEQKAKQIMEAATTYCDNAMKDTEASIGKTLEQVKDTRVAFMTAMKDQK
ncbi:MAG: hypothetical protein E7423_06355 [Ruminococcaceae bacterium]|jgi:cell division septum initiation protein DivIVA|nr:hypothetical protein [Oscillospiraceae bacterium]